MSDLQDAVTAAESVWLDRWAEGPTEQASNLLAPGTPAPDLALPDENGMPRRLAEFWADGPALVMFWRHFGCSCGVTRAERLIAELDAYREAGLTPVIIAQGEPDRTARYQAAHGIPCVMLSDPDLEAYRAFGVGHWAVEQVLFDAPPEYWAHSRELGREFQDGRRRQGRPPVDDPWRASAEFVVGANGLTRLAYAYQHCEDYPDPRVLTTAGRLS
jgi:peroxiredoxin